MAAMIGADERITGFEEKPRARQWVNGGFLLLEPGVRSYLGPDVVFPGMPNPPPGYVTKITLERLGGVGPWNPPRR